MARLRWKNESIWCAPFDAQTEWLHDALEKRDAKHQLLLTTSLPADDELEDALEGAQYQLVRRAGYVQSDTFAKSPVRKRTQMFMAARCHAEQAVPRHAVYRRAE